MKQWLRLLLLSCLTLLAAPAWADPSPTLSVVPAVAYPDSSKDDRGQPVTTYSMTMLLSGATFSADPNAIYWLRFDGKTPLRACSTPELKPSREPLDLTKCVVRIEPSNGNTQATFTQLPADLAGARKFSIVPDANVTEKLPSGQQEIAFALFSSAAVRIFAAVFVLVLLGFVLLLLNSGRQRVLATGAVMGLLRAAFVDTETRTYSLSKLQFYIWGFAVVSGYVYLTMARSLVQGAFEFADIPGNLALLMGISVGTSVASVGVSSVAGTKGSGDVDPTPSDFITSGGVVAPERLLHLLWTVIGGLGFIVFAFSVAPETINNLPSVPNGFLELMGVSAAGYVAGKVARGPGPNIQAIIMNPPNGGAAGAAVNPLPIQIDGANLSVEGATYLMAPAAAAAGTDTQVQLSQPFGTGSVVDTARKTATRIKTSIAPVPPNLTFAVGSRYRFTIINPDGEKAVWEFDVT